MSRTESAEIRAARKAIEELGAERYDLSPTSDAQSLGQCDMVMKGGITSGVVYPLAICRLATKYRLRSIGGTSAGAIAAVLAAASEFRRQTSDDPEDAGAGYRRLSELPVEIAVNLPTLFQPLPATRRMFEVFNTALDPGQRGFTKTRSVMRTIVAKKPMWFGAGLVTSLVVALPGLVIANGLPVTWWQGWARIGVGLLLPLLAGAVVGVLLAVVGLALEAIRVLPKSGFALADGSKQTTDPALTAWLARMIDEIAGMGEDECLTLGHLWGAEAVEAWKTAAAANQVGQEPIWTLRDMRTVDLEVMTTDLTVRRPYRLPLDTQEFLFAESEMRQLFPEKVVCHMKFRQSDEKHPDTGEPLWYFPGPGTPSNGEERPGPHHLPIVVMARMSLSFPGLIGAVPLYAVDFNGDQSVVRHVFSDGGISSNFPMHFFDALLPTRPTFGINLAGLHPLHPQQKVWRPHPTYGGIIPRARPFESLTGFGAAILDTMQNWADNKQVNLRGYADRVVEIRLSGDEGGMNLRMPEERVLKLAGRGAEAGRDLLDFDWAVHRVMRYRTALVRLNQSLGQLKEAWERDNGELYPGLLDEFPEDGTASTYMTGPKGDDGSGWREADLAATAGLVAVIAGWQSAGWPALGTTWPNPSPVLRMAPE